MNEFDLIKHYFNQPDINQSDTDQLNANAIDSSVKVSIGDDCALLQPSINQQLLVSTDTMIKGVHYPEWTSPVAIGHKLVTVNVSDIVACGGRAKWCTLSLTLPEVNQQWLTDFAEGLFLQLAKYNIRLVGGDTTKGNESLSLTIIGEVNPNEYISRNAAKVGDFIYLSSHVGDAGLALSIQKIANHDLNHDFNDFNLSSISLDVSQTAFFNSAIQKLPKVVEALNQKLDFPEPAVNDLTHLAPYASSMIDVSDGVLQDLQHILTSSSVKLNSHKLKSQLTGSIDNIKSENSEKPNENWVDNLGANLTLTQESLSTNFNCFTNELKVHETFANIDWVKLALTSGDDYVLCFTVPHELNQTWQSTIKKNQLNSFCIGQVDDSGEVRLNGEKVATIDTYTDTASGNNSNPQGFMHF